MSEFRFTTYAQHVIFGPGALRQLGETVDRFGWRRLLLCAGGSARRNGRAAQVEAELGQRLVAVYDHVQPHVQDFQVTEALALALDQETDAVIGLGGGSPIGMAKAVAGGLEEKPIRAAVVAIPTTYAGSEMTPVYGVTHTHASPPRKITVANPNSVPRLVIYDPHLTLDLPPELTASTGVNALAHCIEALYSITRHPLSSAAAVSGVRHIVRALPRCYAAGDDLDARTEMLMGAHLAGASLAGVSMGLHHGLCHVLGGTAGVPHGIANSIILPHAMRFNADVTAPLLAPAAEAMGIADKQNRVAAVETAAQRVHEMVGQMNLPQRLRETSVHEADLPHLARLAFENRTVQNNPKPIREAAQIEALLRAAW
jgi:maleylacetate reductase